MNIPRPKTIVLLGFLSHFPVPGVAWQTIHYLLGFRRLGFEVFYVEAHGCEPSKLMQGATDDGPRRAADYISRVLGQFDLGDRWAYHSRYPSDRYFGLSGTELHNLYDSADWLINLHGSHLPHEELARTGRLVYVETDPVEVEIALHQENQETADYLAPHCAFFTFGERIGCPDCLVPAPTAFDFQPTRQPVVLDLWQPNNTEDAASFTSIGNWRQPWREVSFEGEIYRWSKHLEFQKFIDLPRRTGQSFELALSSSSTTPEDLQLLQEYGWRVRDALDFSDDLIGYQRYILQSRGEFTVAKDQNIRLRSGWFSDRAATYLAAGRPVISQDTGFSSILPSGEGLFPFTTLSEIVNVVDLVNADYPRQRKAALAIAREFFSHEVVLGDLLERLGERGSPRWDDCQPNGHALPGDLLVQPISRWPTRLPETTLQIASALPVPSLDFAPTAGSWRASVILVTHNGLAYTKMCVTSLLLSGWHPQDELILIDNASVDGTPMYLEELRSRYSFIKVVANAENRGFAAANNQGLKLAQGDALILLNNDTLVTEGWQDRLVDWLTEPQMGLVGPVTNRTCNEAQIDAPYRTYKEFSAFAESYTRQHRKQGNDISMLAMFCVAFSRDLLTRVGPLDEQFEVGMFEDDDYAERVRRIGRRIVCAEDVYIHHFGQASMGELCVAGRYDEVLHANQLRFEAKWGRPWKPHARRITPEYESLRERIGALIDRTVGSDATVLIVSKGDDLLLRQNGDRAQHFPQDDQGHYANLYPANSQDAILHLESLRSQGATHLLIPKPALWWLDYYDDFAAHLRHHCPLLAEDPLTGSIFELGGPRA